ncbi:glycosyltransferase [Butyrivibrio sp. INlla16]|uniref:glycosyltransferase n=1 Tax=Butyrivibrio sp. INlla16 TaxID=1520807 RepID=UPI000882D4E4|nr:glycosyltransferase [Butyrivibrio sp. INlla16]SDB63040.1 Glycosyl transferase family 2 [Butyrivibrio sp. INlla16]
MLVKEILKVCNSSWIEGKDKESSNETFDISVILPVLMDDDAILLRNALNSICEQSHKKVEVIIVDDSCNVLIQDVIDEFLKKDSRVKCIRHGKSICYIPIMKYEAFLHVKGTYLAFCSSNIEWHLDYITNVMEFIEKTKAEACFSEVKWCQWNDKKRFKKLGTAKNWTNSINLAIVNPIAQSGVLVKKSIFMDQRVGLFDPHLMHIGYDDWSLWKRIKKYYIFHETSIFCGYEYTASKKKMDLFPARNIYNLFERECESKEISFIPENYEQVDIFGCSNMASDHYRFDLKNAIIDYCNKYNLTSCDQDTHIIYKRKRIAIIGAFNATVELNFENYSFHSDRFVFCFLGTQPDIRLLLLADAVICIRSSMFGGTDYLELCKNYNIPCYYYTDDNFCELHTQFPENTEFELLSEQMGSGWLKTFDGVLVSTDSLRDYFIEHKFVNNESIVMFPCVLSDAIKEDNNSNRLKTIAFLGGKSRAQYFAEHIYKYIKEIAKNNEVRLICASDDELIQLDAGNISVEFFDRTDDIQVLLNEVAKYKPDILIHFGEEGLNSKYKTVNALWNALCIGAVLVVNNIEPYKTADINDCCYILDKEEQLVDIISAIDRDQKICKEKYQNALRYCKKEYSFEKADNILLDFINIKESDYGLSVTNRLLQYHDNLYDNKSESRPIYSQQLSFAGPIKNKSVYYVVCTNDTIDRIGMCFARCSEKKALGTVEIHVYNEQKELLCSEKKDMSELAWNNWTYFYFDQKYGNDMRMHELKICIICKYEKSSEKIGVFELTGHRRSAQFIKRILGLPTRRVDTLFVDC